MIEFKKYRNKQIVELFPFEEGEDLSNILITPADRDAGSPKAGDMVRNLKTD